MGAFTEPALAWEPLTPRGVAAFARASFERLFVVQGIFALIAAAALVWVLSDGVFPVAEAAISQLPDTGSIHGGKLDWRDDSPLLLAESRMLAVSVDMSHEGKLRSPADFQIEFGRESLVIYSLFGESEVEYPHGYIISANQRDARPAWGAWAPNILAMTAIIAFIGILFVWALLATVYSAVVWLVCFFTNRDLSLAGCWRLSAAALMPGALIMSASLVLYELGAFDLLQLCFAFGMHLVVGWIYLFVSPVFLKSSIPATPSNPFAK